MTDEAEARRRALAALRALAVGDAMGAATEGYLPAEVEEVYEAPIAELVEPVNLFPESAADRPIGAVGPVTRGALVAVTLLEGGDGLLSEAEALGGAVALGIATPVAAREALLAYAARWGGGAAAAVAGAVSAAVGGYLGRDAVTLAVALARQAGSPALAQRVLEACGLAQESGGPRVGAAVAVAFPPGPAVEDAAVFAIAVAFGAQSARRAIPEAVNQGRLSSLSAGLAGAICGALAPASIVESWADQVEAASGLDLAAVAERLIAIRQRASS